METASPCGYASTVGACSKEEEKKKKVPVERERLTILQMVGEIE